MSEPIKIPGTSWKVKIIPQEIASNNILIQLIKGPHVIYEHLIQKESSSKKIINEFMKTESISIPLNRIDNLIYSIDEQIFEIEATERSTEQKTFDNIIKLTDMEDKKIILMGLEEAGKSTIYEVVFGGKNWWDIQNMYPTRGIQRNQQGSSLFIWDLGGQEAYLKEYREKADEIFPSTTIIIFVVDAGDPESMENSRKEFLWVLEKIDELSPNALKFCFFHKMDKFANPQETFNMIRDFFFEKIKDPDVEYVSTSVRNDSIYIEMNKMFKNIISKSKKLNILAQRLKDQINIYNVVVLEKRTGLPICASSTMFDDIVLIGTINKLWEGTAKLAEDLELIKMDTIRVECGNGYLYFEEFKKNLMLLLISPDLASIENYQNQKFIEDFKNDIKKYV